VLAACHAGYACYARHFQLVEQHQELCARDALKTRQIADMLNDLLTHRGCDEAIARLAAEIRPRLLRDPSASRQRP
jgi:hypothetical protein